MTIRLKFHTIEFETNRKKKKKESSVLRTHTAYIYTSVSVLSKYPSLNSKNINEKEIDGLHFDITLDTVNPDVGYDCLRLIHEWDINLNLFSTLETKLFREIIKRRCTRVLVNDCSRCIIGTLSFQRSIFTLRIKSLPLFLVYNILCLCNWCFTFLLQHREEVHLNENRPGQTDILSNYPFIV